MPVNVRFHYLNVQFFFPFRKTLKGYLQHILKNSKGLNRLTVVFCKDDYLLEMNELHMRHLEYTDILTFCDHELGLAEIYISIDRVRENSRAFRVSFSNELHRIIFHGVLHVLGFRDDTKQKKIIMTQKEDRLLKVYFERLGRST